LCFGGLEEGNAGIEDMSRGMGNFACIITPEKGSVPELIGTMTEDTDAPDEMLIRGDFSSAELEEAEAELRVGDEKVNGKEESKSWGWR
jgi:hypothetical protein